MSTAAVVEVATSPAVEVTEHDFAKYVGATIRARDAGDLVLGPEDRQTVLDAFPKVIRDRIARMTPPHFEVVEITIKLQLSGKVFGVGVAGDVTAKFAPTKR